MKLLRVIMLLVLVCWADCQPVPTLQAPTSIPATMNSSEEDEIPATGLPVAGPSTQPSGFHWEDYE